MCVHTYVRSYTYGSIAGYVTHDDYDLYSAWTPRYIDSQLIVAKWRIYAPVI